MYPPIQKYSLPEFSFSDFPPGTRVVDVGCGTGRHLRELVAHGCRALGLEIDRDCVVKLRAEGFEVVEGKAEQLPFASESFEGIVCSVVVPCTDERPTIAEWARILVPGGVAHVSYHGFGYPLRRLLFGNTLKLKFFGLRTILNSWGYSLTGRRIPGWLGDALYQSPRRLTRYYRQFGFRLLTSYPTKRLCGFPVFIYHRLQKI